MNNQYSITDFQLQLTNAIKPNSKFVICNLTMSVPQGLGYLLYLFCEKTKKDAATNAKYSRVPYFINNKLRVIPHAKTKDNE